MTVSFLCFRSSRSIVRKIKREEQFFFLSPQKPHPCCLRWLNLCLVFIPFLRLINLSHPPLGATIFVLCLYVVFHVSLPPTHTQAHRTRILFIYFVYCSILFSRFVSPLLVDLCTAPRAVASQFVITSSADNQFFFILTTLSSRYTR